MQSNFVGQPTIQILPGPDPFFYLALITIMINHSILLNIRICDQPIIAIMYL